MRRRGEIIFVGVISLLLVALCLLPTGYENSELTEHLLYEKGRVVQVDNRGVEEISVVTLGSQILTVKLLSGVRDGEEFECVNELLGDPRRDRVFEVGDRVLSVVRLDASGEVVEVRAEEYYRQDLIVWLAVGFVVILILFAGWTGAKAALSFAFTAMVFWKILLPALLDGYSPFMVSVGVVVVVTTVIILLVGGVSRRGVVALLGAISGVVVTSILALLFGHLFKIPGTVVDYSSALLYSGFADLNFSDMFLSTIFISSAGAVMDVAMDISAAQTEILKKAPRITRRELIRSGLSVASPVVGSMTTTLLFAYSGSFLFAFMAFMAQGVPIESLLNRAFISAEILHTLVGSFGLILVAPLTALFGGVLRDYSFFSH